MLWTHLMMIVRTSREISKKIMNVTVERQQDHKINCVVNFIVKSSFCFLRLHLSLELFIHDMLHVVFGSGLFQQRHVCFFRENYKKFMCLGSCHQCTDYYIMIRVGYRRGLKDANWSRNVILLIVVSVWWESWIDRVNFATEVNMWTMCRGDCCKLLMNFSSWWL